MRPLLRTALASLGCAVLAACSDEPTSAPRAPTALRPNLETAVDPGPLQVITPCDVNALRSDARLYANRSNDLLFTIISDLGQAVRNGPSRASTDKAFDGLARMAAIRGRAAQKPGATGEVFDRLVKRFVGCMQSSVYANVKEPNPPTTATLGGGFKQALGDGWVFEVRGKESGLYADSTDAAFERSTATPETWWAVDVPTGSSWPDAIKTSITDDRVLIFGWRTSTFIATNARAGSAFEHRTLPDINKANETGPDFALDVNVGLCFADDAAINQATQRVNHNSKFLPPADPIRCGSVVPPLVTPSTGSLAFRHANPLELARRAVDFFMPQTAHAAMFFGGSITGRPDDFSPSAVIDLSQVRLVFDTISNGFVKKELTSAGPAPHPVRVYAFSLDGNPIPGVDVVVRIAGNSSSIAFFGGSSSDSVKIEKSMVTVTGNADGYAELKGVTLTKAGGYILSAQVNVADFVGATAFNSLGFNIQNK